MPQTIPEKQKMKAKNLSRLYVNMGLMLLNISVCTFLTKCPI